MVDVFVCAWRQIIVYLIVNVGWTNVLMKMTSCRRNF